MLALATPGQAADVSPFSGRWAVEGSKACTPQAGDDDLLLTITAKRLSYYASSCDVISSRRLSRSGDNARRFKLRCTGEGQTSNKELVLAVLEKNELRPDMLVHIEPASWALISYLRCPG